MSSDAEFLYNKLKEIVHNEYKDEIERLKRELEGKEESINKEIDKYKSYLHTGLIDQLVSLKGVYDLRYYKGTTTSKRLLHWIPCSKAYRENLFSLIDNEAIDRVIEIIRSNQFEKVSDDE